MKFKYVAITAITSAIMLSACDININTGGDDSNKSSSESKSNDSQKIMINKVMTINQILTTHKIVIKVIVRKVTNKMLQHKITTILM